MSDLCLQPFEVPAPIFEHGWGGAICPFPPSFDVLGKHLVGGAYVCLCECCCILPGAAGGGHHCAVGATLICVVWWR